MVEFIDALFVALVKHGLSPLVFVSAFIAGFCLGSFAGWGLKRVFAKPDIIFEKQYTCVLEDKNGSGEFSLSVPVRAKNDKIVQIDCPFVKNGVCSKTGSRCLIFSTLV